MGLTVDIYRSARRDGIDCSANGISARFTQLTLVNVDGPFDPSEKAPAAMLVRGNIPGCVKIVPAVKDHHGDFVPEPHWLMFGGNFASTCDSRLGEAIAKLIGSQYRHAIDAVPIHDRCEG